MDKKKIRYLVMDVDGTLTDGRIYMGDRGEICKAFHVRDGYGICRLLRNRGIIPVVLTGRQSEIVTERCRELGVEMVFQGEENKEEKLCAVFPQLAELAYIGDDLNDLCCMKLIKESGGLVGCPENAAEDVLKIADFVAEKKGGEGAVRDFIEWILS